MRLNTTRILSIW